MFRFGVILLGLSAGGVGFAQNHPDSLPSAPSPVTRALPGEGSSITQEPPFDTPPKLLFSPAPESSEAARSKRISGNVEVFLHVMALGLVDAAKVVRELGYGLDEKALEAVRLYRFEPAMKNGRPVACVLYVEVNFASF